MFTVRNPLMQFLYERAPNPDLVPAKLACLEPLFQAILSMDNRLAPDGQVYNWEAAWAISEALGAPGQRVIKVSRSRPFEKAPWMTEESVRQILGCALSHNLGRTFSRAFLDHCDNVLPLADTSEVWNKLWATLRSADAERDCYAALGSDLGCKLGDVVRSSVGHAIERYLALSLADDEENSERLGPLIYLLAVARPIGEKKDEPGTWLVLVE